MNEHLSSLVAAMEILPDGLLLVDRRQRIIGCNRVAERIFGYRHGELVDQPLSVLLPPSVRDVHAKRLADFVPPRGGRRMEDRPILFGMSKSGARLPLSIGISTIGEQDERVFVAVVRDASSFDDTLEDAMLLAETDPLTQLGNRRFLSSKLGEYVKSDDAPPIALLFLDLDRFKPLNDTYGHEAGDEVLGIVARRLRTSLRDSDTCIRLGGDEFVVLVAGVEDPAALERIALKLHASVVAPMHLSNVTASVGVSIGGVIGSPSRAGADHLLERADAAMYQAKTAGVPYRFHKTRQVADV
jgi:diguanylate cyclase (GGDEF)-like protein/PAS domain S-box-containing protein